MTLGRVPRLTPGSRDAQVAAVTPAPFPARHVVPPAGQARARRRGCGPRPRGRGEQDGPAVRRRRPGLPETEERGARGPHPHSGALHGRRPNPRHPHWRRRWDPHCPQGRKASAKAPPIRRPVRRPPLHPSMAVAVPGSRASGDVHPAATPTPATRPGDSARGGTCPGSRRSPGETGAVPASGSQARRACRGPGPSRPHRLRGGGDEGREGSVSSFNSKQSFEEP